MRNLAGILRNERCNGSLFENKMWAHQFCYVDGCKLDGSFSQIVAELNVSHSQDGVNVTLQILCKRIFFFLRVWIDSNFKSGI